MTFRLLPKLLEKYSKEERVCTPFQLLPKLLKIYLREEKVSTTFQLIAKLLKEMIKRKHSFFLGLTYESNVEERSGGARSHGY